MKIELNLPHRTITADIPDTWNDCIVEDADGNRNPALAITLLQTLQLSGPSIEEKRIAILRHLLALTDEDIREWQISLAMKHGKDWKPVFFDQVQALLASTDFLLEKVPGSDAADQLSIINYQLSPSLTRCPIPIIHVPAAPEMQRHRKKPTVTKLYAPADGMANITGWEMALLFDLYTRYAETKDLALVDELIAVLYRKGKTETPEQLEENWHGDRRQPFNEHSVELRKHQFKALPAEIKNIILFWFLSCRMDIINRFSDIFESKTGGEPDGKDFGWWAVFRQLSGNLKDTEAMSKMNHLDLLTELSFLKEERRKEEMRAAMAG